MAAISSYLEESLLFQIFNNVTSVQPANIYIGLYIEYSNDAGTAQEVTGATYARQPVNCDGGPGEWSLPIPFGGGGYSVTNTIDITYPVANDAWGNILSVGLFSALGAGNLLFHGNLTAPKVVATNDQFKILAGSLVVALR